MAAEPLSEPTVTTDFQNDEGPLTTISVPWTEPSSPLPGTDASPAEKINIYLRAIPLGKIINNSKKTIFAINVRSATHTSLVYIILKDSRGYLHVLSINKQILSLFPKKFNFPAADYMNVISIEGNRLEMVSKNDSGHYRCSFEIAVQPSGALKLLQYEAYHE